MPKSCSLVLLAVTTRFQHSLLPEERSPHQMLVFCTFGGPLTNAPQHCDVCGGLIYAIALTSPFFLKYCSLLLVSLTSRDRQQAQSAHRSSEIKYHNNYSERCRRVSSSISERVEASLHRDESHFPFKVRIMNVISSNDEICSLGRCH